MDTPLCFISGSTNFIDDMLWFYWKWEWHSGLQCVQPLSEEIHFKDNEHNSDYDHEAFLGKDDVKEFEHMTPEDSQQQLG